MLKRFQFAKAVFLGVLLGALSGCGTTPMPAPALLTNTPGGNIAAVAQAPPSSLAVVMKYIASNLVENAGLKIAGKIADEGEPPYVFAAPGKSDGLLVVCIKELNVASKGPEIRLTLLLRVFDGSGENIYARSITGVSGAYSPQNKLSDTEIALQVITKDVLRQYAKDPVLRPLIMKYKLGALMKFM